MRITLWHGETRVLLWNFTDNRSTLHLPAPSFNCQNLNWAVTGGDGRLGSGGLGQSALRAGVARPCWCAGSWRRGVLPCGELAALGGAELKSVVWRTEWEIALNSSFISRKCADLWVQDGATDLLIPKSLVSNVQWTSAPLASLYPHAFAVFLHTCNGDNLTTFPGRERSCLLLKQLPYVLHLVSYVKEQVQLLDKLWLL